MSRHKRKPFREQHHRKMKSHQGTDDPRNISWVTQRQHSAFHHLFGNCELIDIMKALNTIWIDPDYEFVLRRKVPYLHSALHNW
jgi:hypothetical protein